MGSRKASAEEKPSAQNPKKLRRPLGTSTGKKKKRKLGDYVKKTSKRGKEMELRVGVNDDRGKENSQKGGEDKERPASTEERLGFFLNHFESANGARVSSLELELIKDKCIVELSQDLEQDVSNLGNHVKSVFGSSFSEVLCENQLVEEKVDPGSPAVLIISSSALGSLELLRGLRSLTKQCPAVKLFSKHMKVEEQVSLLKKRVNIGSGTPSRIKKLIDIEALGLSRLEVIVLDVHTDVKGYSLFTLPQVRDEFWDLYKNYFHQRVLQGDLRICLYGPIPKAHKLEGKKRL